MCEPCNVLQSGPRFDFIQPFFLFWNLCSASAIQLPMDLCNAFAIQPISFFRCKSKLSQFNSFPWQWRFVPTFQWLRPPCSSSIKLQISNPRFPLLLFTLSHTPTQKTTLPLYPSLRIFCKFPMLQILSNSQCCKSCRTPCQPSGSTRCPTNMTQGSQRKPSRVEWYHKHLVRKFHFYPRKMPIQKCRHNPTGNHHSKDHRAHFTVKIGLQMSPYSAIHLERHSTVWLL